MAQSDDPFDRFAQWFAEAETHEPNDPNAMNLATVDADGRPSSRMVLLKGWDRDGFVFYTNTDSRKGRQIANNPEVALCFHWKTVRRSVRIEGRATPVEGAEADAYFASRPRGSQVGAWASSQSQPMAGRFELEKRVARFGLKFGLGHVPRPPHWSGYRVVPRRIEFWRDMPFRLHERHLFTRADGNEAWTQETLFP